MSIIDEKTKVTAHIVNGFVKNGTGGNPAGVVFDADHLTDEDMLQIAAKIGLSETAFVSSSDKAGFRLDFFTPNRRIAHCGHATIAAFAHMAETGAVAEGETSKMTVDGPRKIIIKGEQAFMEQIAPSYETPAQWSGKGVSLPDVLRSLGLGEADMMEGVDPQLVNTGNSFVVVPVKNEDVLAGITPDLDAISAISDKLDLIGYYVFATSPRSSSSHATTRMFAPRYAIPEEAATGMAAGPLGCFLYDVMGIKETHMTIDQGDFMTPASPSTIMVDLTLDTTGAITSLTAGGYGRSMRQMEIELE
ncbi:PhzF family phenazine biosynthesis protein [uncultured Roseobacter sp.]|uniref:PhzF family phenazine biosynthesis protein n=1 Tax=uncultured Roseobacter sp. TaxID=114847 RepID=UPI00260A159A|nr:PhzF family phenazine biosynthesis protein [uncultured Roseobacter sp.]